MTQAINQKSYRPDIDGLRAIAVVSVVLFHFGIGPFQGGFAGVDVFYVISGYLITGIIHKEVAADEFTFAGFYERRVRRIFPALFAMLFAVIVAAYFILLPSDLNRLGASVIATLLFGSNILFWKQSGYFDPASHFNPLLHTWSLAVEEQFYIGFPILMILIERHARKHIIPILALIGAISFAICVWRQPVRPTTTFYLSPFRAWELMLGAILAVKAVPIIAHRMKREFIAGAALLTLIASLLLLKEGPNFPGWIAAFPVVATATLLHTGASGESQARRLLALRPMVLVGLISYSLYLWHWPLVVFANYANSMEPLPAGSRYALLALALLAGWASYRWVETPFRRRGSAALPPTRKMLFTVALASMALLGLLATTTWIDNGWQMRFPPAVVEMDQLRNPVLPYQQCDAAAPSMQNPNCIGGTVDGTRTILLWGDSHALAWAPAVDVLSKKSGLKAIMAPNSACPPLFDVSNPVDPSCERENDRVRTFIRTTKPDVVILVAAWQAYSIPHGRYTLSDRQGRNDNKDVFAPALVRTIRELRPFIKRIILVGPTPAAPIDAPFNAAQSLRSNSRMPKASSLASVRERDRWFWNEALKLDRGMQLYLVDPVPWFCTTKNCRYIDTNGVLLYRDNEHLNIEGAKLVARKFSLTLLSHTPGK